jgi:hypothetical protein
MDQGSRPIQAKKIFEYTISTNKIHAWWCAPVIPTMQGSVTRRITVQAGLGIHVRPYSKKLTKGRRAGSMAQVVEHLCKQA